jgi:hypothetical protein
MGRSLRSASSVSFAAAEPFRPPAVSSAGPARGSADVARQAALPILRSSSSCRSHRPSHGFQQTRMIRIRSNARDGLVRFMNVFYDVVAQTSGATVSSDPGFSRPGFGAYGIL